MTGTVGYILLACFGSEQSVFYFGACCEMCFVIPFGRQHNCVTPLVQVCSGCINIKSSVIDG